MSPKTTELALAHFLASLETLCISPMALQKTEEWYFSWLNVDKRNLSNFYLIT